MSKYCMIEIAFDNMDEVKKVVDILLSERFVASAHIIESNSSWNWKDKRENAKEFLLQLKTRTENQKNIYEIVKNIHSYECFEFAVYELNSINVDYLKWIDEETN